MSRIAFDVDGVLTDLNQFLREYGTKFFEDNQSKYKEKITIVDENASGLKEMFDCTSEQERDFWKKYLFFYTSKIKARIGASDFLRKLAEDGNELYLVSARIKACENDFIGNLIKDKFYEWVKEECIPIKKENIQFCPWSDSNETANFKAKWCVENRIDYFVEDSVENIELLRRVTNVICFETPYNKNYSAENVEKVDYFYKLYNIISKNYPQTSFRELKRAERELLSEDELERYYFILRQKYMCSKIKTNLELTERRYRTIYPIFRKVIQKKYNPEVENEDLLESIEPGTIFVINHRDMIDLPLAITAIGKNPVHLLLKSEFENSKAGNFLNNVGCVFVKRGNEDSRIIAKEEMSKILLSGHNVMMCPEGTRNKTSNNLLPFELGAVSMAKTTGANIRPIVIRKKFDDFSEKICVTIGEDFKVGIHDNLEEKNNELHDIIEKMYLGEEFRINQSRRM